MLTCAQCRAAQLDRLYDLLDPAEAAALDAHLSACPACQAERLKAERVQRLLSAAARTEFPGVRFEAPAATAPASAPARDGRKTGAAGRPRFRWLGWAVA